MCDTCNTQPEAPAGPDPGRLARRTLLRGGLATAGAMAVAPHLLRSGRAASTAGGPRPAGELDLAAVRPVSSTFATPPPPPIIRRAEWGADESWRNGDPKFAPIQKFILHHTVTVNDETDPAGRVRAIYRHHTQGRGWADIGYNFVVDREGRVYEGRFARTYSASETASGEDSQGRGVIGAHAAGTNTGSVGIAVLGTYGTTAPSPAAIDSIVRLIAWKAGPRGIDPRASDPYRRADGSTVTFPNITGHSDVVATSCPGDAFRAQLPAIRDRVANVLLSGLAGYRIVSRDGAIRSHGVPGIRDLPEMGIRVDNIVGAAGTPSGRGLWLAGSDGGVFALGDALFLGSMGAVRLNQPVVGMAATPTGLGYWLVAADGGIFSFGDAIFAGSTGNLRLNQPVVGMASSPTGRGYWLVASDGGIFTFGDARFHGSTGNLRLNEPVFGMAPTTDGRGYWLVARDGGIFTFGNAGFRGSVPGLRTTWSPPARGIAGIPSDGGYLIVDNAGGVHAFGGAPRFGAGTRTGSPATAIVPVVIPDAGAA